MYMHMCLCVLHLDGSKNLRSANATSFLLLEQNHIQSRDVSSFGNEVLQNLLELTLPVLQFAASYYIYIYYIYSYAYIYIHSPKKVCLHQEKCMIPVGLYFLAIPNNQKQTIVSHHDSKNSHLRWLDVLKLNTPGWGFRLAT